MKKLLFATMILLSSLSFAQLSESPFTDVIYDRFPSIQVEFDSDLYYLLAINGTSREEIMNACHAAYPSDCKKLFAQDFKNLMNSINLSVDDTVSLKLYYLETHQVIEIPAASLSIQNSEEIQIKRDMRGEN